MPPTTANPPFAGPLRMEAADVLTRLAAMGADVRDLSADSRAVAPGTAFLAYPGHGAKRDGRAFIGDALARGASAVLWERDGFTWRSDWAVPNLGLDGLKALAGPLAAALHGHPSRALNLIGVTGTNGKTSVTQWAAQALGRCAAPCGVIGTLGARFGDIDLPVPNTTPDAIVLQRVLARMRDAGATACAMEVSSIGLDQARVAGCEFDIAVFTNFTRDHLDYHGSLEAYEAAKTKLFLWEGLSHAVINVDDPMGLRLMMRMPESVERIACSVGGGDALAVIDAGRLIARDVRHGATGVAFRLGGDWGCADVAAPVWGAFNVANLLSVIGILLASGAPLDLAAAAVGRLAPVPGRMQAPGGEGEPLVVVDYAHTPDALAKALEALRPVADARGGRLIAVFGAGGDRDAGKRPLMGEVAARLADAVLLTSDNPRSEDPAAIVAAIAAGAPGAVIELDRARAIGRAVREAAVRDVVLVAGKGHEDYQEAGGTRLPFSDHLVARAALQDRSPSNPGDAS